MDPESHPSGSRFYRGLPITGSIILRLRVLEKETDALRFSLFFVLFIEGADPLKLPCVGLRPPKPGFIAWLFLVIQRVGMGWGLALL